MNMTKVISVSTPCKFWIDFQKFESYVCKKLCTLSSVMFICEKSKIETHLETYVNLKIGLIYVVNVRNHMYEDVQS